MRGLSGEYGGGLGWVMQVGAGWLAVPSDPGQRWFNCVVSASVIQPCTVYSEGQAPSMKARTSSVDAPFTQLRMPSKKAADPTAPGMRSDASKRKVVSGS